MIYHPPRAWPAVLALVALMVALLVADAAMAVSLVRIGIEMRSLILGLLIAASLPLLLTLAYWLWGMLSLRYRVDRNALVIEWAGNRHIVPTPAIRQVYFGQDVPGIPRVVGFRWLGYAVGQGDVAGVGPTVFFSSLPIEGQIILQTARRAYAISPGDRIHFLDELTARARLGPTEPVAEAAELNPWLALGIWRDTLAHRLFAAAVVTLIALFGWVVLRYPSLPSELTLGGAALPPAAALILPTIGLIALLGNAIFAVMAYRRQRPAAYLVLGGAVLVQMAVWFAALRALA